MSEEQVLTIKEIAEILKLAEKTVYSMAQDGELPTFKVRGQWRIRKVDFEKWMAEQAKPKPTRTRKDRK
jgi:excisionase family DNA binding protein